MTQEQIDNLGICQTYARKLKDIKENLPMKPYFFGCGSQSPPMEHTVEEVHRSLYKKVLTAIEDAEEELRGLIREI